MNSTTATNQENAIAVPAMPKKKIIVAQRGWVFIGNYHKDGTTVTLSNSHCIRRWGTTGGLGQLAMTGKTPETVLDSYGTVSFHELAIVAEIEVTSTNW